MLRVEDKGRLRFNKSTMSFTTVTKSDFETVTKRPVNYCIEDASYIMVINPTKKEFTKFNINKQDDYIEDTFIVSFEQYRIIYNKNATIVILKDGSKGISKCDPEDKFNKEIGEEIAYGRALAKSLKKKYGHIR